MQRSTGLSHYKVWDCTESLQAHYSFLHQYREHLRRYARILTCQYWSCHCRVALQGIMQTTNVTNTVFNHASFFFLYAFTCKFTVLSINFSCIAFQARAQLSCGLPPTGLTSLWQYQPLTPLFTSLVEKSSTNARLALGCCTHFII